MKIYRFIASYFFILLISFSLSCQQQADIFIKINRVSDRVIVFECVDVNTTAIASSKGIIVIDTNRSPGIMKEIKKLIVKEFGRDNFLYVINTHGHYDHSSGNQIFQNSIIIGHENCPEFMRQKPANSLQIICYLKYRLSTLKTQLKDLDIDSDDAKRLRADIKGWNIVVDDIEKRYVVTPPSKTFRDSLRLDLVDLTLKLIYCGNAHTNHDIFISVPEEKLVLTGDMFTSKYSFGFSINKMTDVPKIIFTMDKVLKDENGIQYVVPGHGDVFFGDDLISLRDLLKEKFDHFKGKDKESAAQYLEKMIEDNGIKLALQKYYEFKIKQNSKYYVLEDEFNTLGNRLLGRGLIAEAIEVFKVSALEFPNSAIAYDYLGEAYLKKGEFELAIKNYEKSLQIFPENRILHLILSCID